MNTEAIERLVLAEVDRYFDEAVTFLRELVHQPSTLGNEGGAQGLVSEYIESMGLDAEMWEVDLKAVRNDPAFGPLDISYVGRPNVTAVWPASADGGRSLILNGHIDVVSPGPLEDWSFDPWDARIDGDWMYGRGAADMKSGIAAMLLAVKAVRSAGVGLRGDVIIETVVEEECTGNGALACALRGFRADAALIPEPTDMHASLATVGVIWFRVTTRGQSSHVLAAQSAVNAIEKMHPVIRSLRDLERALNAEDRHPLYRLVHHPINLNVGVMRGGDWPSTVPSRCSLVCRLSFLPGYTVQRIQTRVKETVASAAESDPWLCENPPEVQFFGFRAESSLVDPSTPPMRILAECHQGVTGNELEFRPGTATGDQRIFINNLHIPATSYGPVSQHIHAPNESVFVPSIAQVAQVLGLCLLRWCGVA
jgi:acetylornithine deacetylase